MDQNEVKASSRPFYFATVVWGESFRTFLLHFALPSLLAPDNIPSLDGRRPAKFVVASTQEDWAVISAAPIFQRLRRHAEPIFLELPQSDAPHWERAYLGHLQICNVIARDRAYRILIGPDAMYSNGAIARLHELAEAGAQVVLKLTMPTVDQNLFFEELDARGMLPDIASRDSGDPLVLAQRPLVAVALRAMHSMFVVNEWEAPYLREHATAPWWRVPGEDGIVNFGMGWDLLLADYDAIQNYDPTTRYERGLDGDFILRNFGHVKRMYAVRDSDEFFIVSWALASYGAYPLEAKRFGELGKGTLFRRFFYGPPFNWLHRTFMCIPTYIHSGPLNDKWKATEERAMRTLLTWLNSPRGLSDLGRDLPLAYRDYKAIEAKFASLRLPWWRRNRLVWALCRRLLRRFGDELLLPSGRLRRISAGFAALRRLARAAMGDVGACRWLGWRIRKLIATLQRRPFREAPPEMSP